MPNIALRPAKGPLAPVGLNNPLPLPTYVKQRLRSVRMSANSATLFQNCDIIPSR
jgi:hypothetical protein